MKRLALALTLLSTNAFANELSFFQNDKGEIGTVITNGKNVYYESNRGSGSGTQVGNTMYWQGHSPGGGASSGTSYGTTSGHHSGTSYGYGTTGRDD